MAYTPTVWKDGDIVTSARLNKMEDGIVTAESSGGGTLIVTTTHDEQTGVVTLNATWQDVYDAMIAGKLVMMISAQGSWAEMQFVVECLLENDEYRVDTNRGGSFYAPNTTDYLTNQHPS